MTEDKRSLTDIQYQEFNRLTTKMGAIVEHACKLKAKEFLIYEECKEHKEKMKSPWFIGAFLASLILDFILRPSTSLFEFNFSFNIGTFFSLLCLFTLIGHQVATFYLEQKKDVIENSLDVLSYEWDTIGSLPNFNELLKAIDERGELREGYSERRRDWIHSIWERVTNKPWDAD